MIHAGGWQQLAPFFLRPARAPWVEMDRLARFGLLRGVEMDRPARFATNR